jgi:predicted ATPase
MAYALFHAGMLHHWLRMPERVEECAGAVLEIAEEHEYQVWKAVGACLRGAALAGMGRPEEGLTLGRAGMDLYQVLSTPPVFWPLILYLQAEIYNQSGKPEQGLSLVNQIPENINSGSGKMLLPEFFRLKGNLLLAHNPKNLIEAELWLQRALEIAQELQANMMELRVALSLCRFWREQDKEEQGHRLLDGVFKKFTEGFTTADLIEARALINNVQKE